MTELERVRAVIPEPIRAHIDDWSDEGAAEYLRDFMRLAHIEHRFRRLDWTFPIVAVFCIGLLIFVSASVGFGNWGSWVDVAIACYYAVTLQRRVRNAKARRADFARFALIAFYVRLTRDNSS